MNINELKAYLKFIGFDYDIIGYTNAYHNGDHVITILRNYSAIRLDNYAERRSLFMSLDNQNFMERLINFIEYEVLILKK